MNFIAKGVRIINSSFLFQKDGFKSKADTTLCWYHLHTIHIIHHVQYVSLDGQQCDSKSPFPSIKNPDKTRVYNHEKSSPQSENTLDTYGKNIVIFITQRSGSSFTGQLFNQNPDIICLFEPLMLMQVANQSIPQHERFKQNQHLH